MAFKVPAPVSDQVVVPTSQICIQIDKKFRVHSDERLNSNFHKKYFQTKLKSYHQQLINLAKEKWEGVEIKAISHLCGTSQDQPMNILVDDIKRVVIIGILIKVQPKKPNILDTFKDKAFAGKENVEVLSVTNFTSPDDYCLLEDCSGRMRLNFGNRYGADQFVQGLTCGIMGVPNVNGSFDVQDIIFPRAIKKPSLLNKMNFELILISGVGYGRVGSYEKTDKLFDFLTGFVTPDDHENGTKIIIFLGNLFDMDEGLNSEQRADLVKKMDRKISSLSDFATVIVMGGNSDPMSKALPQRKPNKILFPLSSAMPKFLPLENPASLNIRTRETESPNSGIDVLFMAGTSVTEMMKNSSTTDPLTAAYKLLLYGDLMPCGCDTLPVICTLMEYIFKVKESPDLLVIGNMDETSMMTFDNTRVLSVSRFFDSQTIAYLSDDMELTNLDLK